jgi:NitT/TauT family transport system substrate-binding protein
MLFGAFHFPQEERMKSLVTYALVVFTILTVTVACVPSAPLSSPTVQALTEVSVVMGYIPNVQFAPFFVADEKGYFAEEGIKINYNWGFEFDGIKLVGGNQSDFAIVTGEQVLQARAQNIPIVYIGNWYNAFPISVVSLADKGIKTPQDLVGKKVGLPGLFGASYTAWRALLHATEIEEQDVQVENIGFTQVQAIDRGIVDAAVVYANNEPVQLELAGKDLNQINIWEIAKLVGNGVVTNEATLKNRPHIAGGFVRALLRGVQDTIDNPNEAFDITVKRVPEAGGETAAAANKAVLDASIPLWKNTRLGESRLEDWQAMEQFMRDAGFIATAVDVNKAFTNELLQP